MSVLQESLGQTKIDESLSWKKARIAYGIVVNTQESLLFTLNS